MNHLGSLYDTKSLGLLFVHFKHVIYEETLPAVILLASVHYINHRNDLSKVKIEMKLPNIQQK